MSSASVVNWLCAAVRRLQSDVKQLEKLASTTADLPQQLVSLAAALESHSMVSPSPQDASLLNLDAEEFWPQPPQLRGDVHDVSGVFELRKVIPEEVASHDHLDHLDGSCTDVVVGSTSMDEFIQSLQGVVDEVLLRDWDEKYCVDQVWLSTSAAMKNTVNGNPLIDIGDFIDSQVRVVLMVRDKVSKYDPSLSEVVSHSGMVLLQAGLRRHCRSETFPDSWWQAVADKIIYKFHWDVG